MSMLLMGCGGSVAPRILTSTVDATGLVFTLVFNVPVTAGVGAPTATSDGNAITLTYTSGTGTNTWVYGITNGNPSGNPVLAGSTVLWSAAAGVFVGGGVANAAVSGGSVTNNSTVT